METSEIGRLKTDQPAGPYRNRIADGHHDRCAGRWGQAEQIGFGMIADRDYQIGKFGQRIVSISSHRDQPGAEMTQVRSDFQYFFTASTVRNRDHQVIRPNSAQVAMNRFAGVQEMSSIAG